MLNFPDNAAPGAIWPPYIFDGKKWQLLETQPSDFLPLVNAGAGNAGAMDSYARGDHVHPTDQTRAPVNSPIFTGTLTTDTLTVTISSTIGAGLRTENGRIVSAGNGQPSVTAHSNARGHAAGFFLDTGNYLAFGYMDGAGNPQTNIARFDNSGHLWVNGTTVVSRDPSGPMEVATKQYVDAKAASGGGSGTAYMPLAGGGMTGLLYPMPSYGGVGLAGWAVSLEVYSINGQDATMSFHIPGQIALNFGLGGNNFLMGGWSHAPNYYQLWSTKDFTGYPASNARMPHAGDYDTNMTVQPFAEPYGGAAMTGGTGCGLLSPIPMTARYRYMQLFTTGWYTIGYV